MTSPCTGLNGPCDVLPPAYQACDIESQDMDTQAPYNSRGHPQVLQQSSALSAMAATSSSFSIHSSTQLPTYPENQQNSRTTKQLANVPVFQSHLPRVPAYPIPHQLPHNPAGSESDTQFVPSDSPPPSYETEKAVSKPVFSRPLGRHRPRHPHIRLVPHP